MNSPNQGNKSANAQRYHRSSKNKRRFSPNKVGQQGVRPPQKTEGAKPAEGQEPKANPRNNSNQNRRSNFFKNRRSPQTPNNSGQTNGQSSGGPLIRKYEHFMEMYLNTRRKFFSHFFNDDKKQRAKSEKTYLAAAQSLREFEQNLGPDAKNSLKVYLNEGKEDLSYSQALAERGELERWEEDRQQIPELSDPHTLPIQKKGSFSGDTEETVAAQEEIANYYKTK